MDWVKRNLLFTIGSLVALGALGAAGYYLYSRWQANEETRTKLNEVYGQLDNLNRENPHPGDRTRKIDNIQAAKDQQQQLKAFIDKARACFNPIAPIPTGTNLTGQEFIASLRRTIDQLQKEATNASVILPQNYAFSFEAQRSKMTFAPGSLPRLAVQLGEIKAICDILIASKVNSLDNIRRERVSSDDSAGPLTDYLEKKSVTNDLAVMTPYEITFRCFSTELASVLSGLGASPSGFVVKTINVEPGGAAATATDPTLQPTFTPQPVMPVYTPQLPAAEDSGKMSAAFARRYGLTGGPGGAPGGVPLRPPGTPPPAYTPPPTMTAVQPAVSRGGLPTVLDEKQIKVTLTLDIVKLLPPK